MARMYLESNNGGYGLLVTDGNKWYYFHESDLPVSLIADTDEENAKIIRRAIANGDMYNADDFINEYGEVDDCGNEGDDNRHYVKGFDGYTLNDIDYHVNYKVDPYSGDVFPLGHDCTTWTEI